LRNNELNYKKSLPDNDFLLFLQKIFETTNNQELAKKFTKNYFISRLLYYDIKLWIIFYEPR